MMSSEREKCFVEILKAFAEDNKISRHIQVKLVSSIVQSCRSLEGNVQNAFQ